MTETVSPVPVATPPKPPRKAMFIVFLVVFIDLLGFGIVLPLLPRYGDRYLSGLGLSRAVEGILIGVLMSSFSAMQFIFAPIWGRMSDRIGRRPILLLGLGGSVVFYALFGLASELAPDQSWLPISLILLTRIGAGIAGATIATAQAVIADCTSKENRSRGMALIGAAFGIGFTFGPLIAFLGLEWFGDHMSVPGYLASGLSAIALLLALRLLPETHTPGVSTLQKSWLDVKGLLGTLKTPTVGLLVLTFFLATFGFAIFESTLSMLTQSAFRLDNKGNSLVFAFLGFVLMFSQGYLYRKFVKKISEVTLLRVGLGLIFLGLVGLGIVAYFASAIQTTQGDPKVYTTVFYAVLALAVTGFAFVNPSLQGLISKRSDPERQGEVLGVNQSFSALARILGPVIGMTLFAAEPSHVLPYVFAGVLLGIMLVLMPRIGK